MAPSVVGYVWNQLAGRFIARNGEFVAFSAVRAALDQALVGASHDAAALAQQLTDGVIGVPQFENAMRGLIKETQIYSMAVAAGGFDSMTQQHLNQLQARLTEQFSFLSDWSDDLAAGKIGSTKQMAARARMYAQSARRTFDEAFRGGQIARGFREERNRLGKADHCVQCVDMSAIGWVLIGTLVPIGLRICLSNCKCVIEYR